MEMVPTKTITYLCVIFIIFANNVCARPSDNNEVPEETIDFNTLLKKTVKFKCRPPQERAYLAKNFLQEGQLNSDEKIVPNNIILRKCDEHSGCCQMDGFSCGQFKTKEVSFEVQAESKFSGEKRTIILSAIEDIECKCGPKSSPKRNDTIDVYVESLLTSAGLTNNTVEYNLLSFMSLLYLIYLLYMFH